jgi:heme/copper-type cytochrome/quinol oxidase subunit 4
MNDKSKNGFGAFLRSRSGFALLVFLAIGAFLLASEHRAHIFTSNGFLVLLLIACVGMHFFMHGGHGRESAGGNDRGKTGPGSGESGRTEP